MCNKDKCGPGGCELDPYVNCTNCGDILHKHDDVYGYDDDGDLVCLICLNQGVDFGE